MKQTKPTMFYSHACLAMGKILGLIAIFLLNVPLQAMVTSTVTADGIKLTVSYNSVVCLGTLNTITYTLENTNSVPQNTDIFVVGFAPDDTQPLSSGLKFVSYVPPQPSGVVSFDPTTPFTGCGVACVNCPTTGAATGQGDYQASSTSQGFPVEIPYTFTITYQATACGLQTFYGYLLPVPSGSCFNTISILVIPNLILSNETITGPLCNNNTAGITGILPFPPCPSGCTGIIDCAFLPCVGCSGPTGAMTYNYTVSGVTGGTVSLVNPSGSEFLFIPDSSFSGTGIFAYNIVSNTQPPAFCSATAAEIFIPIVQSPITTAATLTGCAGQALTGNLAPYVTGGSLSYSFSGLGPASCGSVSIASNGNFLYTGPTGSGGVTCDFAYQATDTVYGCVGTGSVTVNINATPVGTSQTLETCINTPISGTLTATGGSGTIVSFAITTPPVNGTLTAFDSSTGDFTYSPDLNFTGMDTFQFTATDSNACVSTPPTTITIFVDPIPITSSTSIVGCQNTTLTGSLVPLVTGGTGGSPSFSITGTSPSCGGVAIFSNGLFIFTPNFNFTGCCNFNYAVSQGGCPGSGPNTVTVCVTPAPVATGANFNICQFGNVTGNLTNYLISSTGTTTFTAVGAPTNGTLYLNPAGPFSFTATISSGTAGFTYEAISSLLSCPSDPENIVITVHPDPTVATGIINGCSGLITSGNLNPLVSGAGPFIFTGPLTEANGTATVDPNGTFTFTPLPGVTGGSFTFGVTDTFGCSGMGTETIIVNPTPIATGVTGSVCSNSMLNGTLTGAVTGGTPPYIYSRIGLPVGGFAAVNPNGTFLFTPSAGATAGMFAYQVTDEKGCFGTGPVNIKINPAPIAMSGMFTGCDNGFTGSLASLVTGVNPPFTFTGPIGPVINGTVTISPAGNFVFIPIGEGSASFNYEVTDSANPPCMSNLAEVTIDVEQSPRASQATYNTCENVPLAISAASGLANYVTGGLPPYMFMQAGATPACAASLLVNADGSFNFTPALNFTGPCDFLWQVKDSVPCLSNIATAVINVNPAPITPSTGPFAACELDAFIGNLNNYTTGGTPPYSFTGGNPVNGMINYLFASGPFSFTPSSIGLASFQYSAKDSVGCQSVTGTISFDAAESPVITSPSPLNVCQLSSVTSTATATSSPGLQPFTFSITSTTNGSAVITATTATSATFTFTPSVTSFPTPTVTGSVTIRATAAAPSTCFDETTVIINIHQNPVINITGLGSCTGNFTGSLAPFVTGGIPPYIFGPAGLVPTIPPGCGTVILDVFGNFSFTSTGLPCPCAFDFTVTESSVSHCTSTGMVSVCVNKPPFANNVNTCQCVNTPLTLILENFVTGGKMPFTFKIVGTAVGGTVILLNPTTGLVVFVPTPGFSGFASFQYQVTDSNVPPCTSNIGTVTIQIPCCPPTSITP